MTSNQCPFCGISMTKTHIKVKTCPRRIVTTHYWTCPQCRHTEVTQSTTKRT